MIKTEEVLTPQKKCRTKITRTRLVARSPEKRVLNGWDLWLTSKMGRFSTFFTSDLLGSFVETSTFPSKSGVGSDEVNVVLLVGVKGSGSMGSLIWGILEVIVATWTAAVMAT